MRCTRKAPQFFPAAARRGPSPAALAILLAGCSFMGEGLEPYYSGGGPEISGLDISSEQGNVGGGTVTIQGSAFGEVDGLVVLFGDKNAEILEGTDSSVTVVVPKGPVTAGKVKVVVANELGYDVFGDDDSESGYVFDPGPIYGDAVADSNLYEEENAYIAITNFFEAGYGMYIGNAGIDGYAEFMEFTYPRYHTQNINFYGGTDQGPGSEWKIQRPGQSAYISGLEDLRLEVDQFNFYNANLVGQTGYYDHASLMSEEVATIYCEGGYPEYCDPNVKEMPLENLHYCEPAWQDEREKLQYRAQWPAPERFFDADEATLVTLNMSPGEDSPGVLFDDGTNSLNLSVPPPLLMQDVEGMGCDHGDMWTCWSDGAYLYGETEIDECFGDDDDPETTLDDTAVRFYWEPYVDDSGNPVDLAAASSSPVSEATTHVRITLTVMAVSWIGGESFPVRATLVVPDTNDYDAETGLSSVEIPTEVFYQFPTVSDGWYPTGIFATYADYHEPRWGYFNVEVNRVTEYRVKTDHNEDLGLLGDLVIAYTTGEIGFFNFDHPLERDDSCANCTDDDGDGWVDGDDPDCSYAYSKLKEPAEDGTTNGDWDCNDGEDNDGDGYVDADDEDCDEADGMETNCGDGSDNDGDGWADMLDGECIEGGAELGEDDPSWGCTNGLDDDKDDWIDADDPDCVDGTYDEVGLSDFECNNGIDDDGHGDVDALDPYCWYSNDGGWTETEDALDDAYDECVNGLDDDGDGYYDANDPDCERGSSGSEYSDTWDPDYNDLIPECYDQIDNDKDGEIDAYDAGCLNDKGEPDGFLDSEEAADWTDCEDSTDNDGDGWIDAYDADCSFGTDENAKYDANYACSDGKDNDGDKLVDADDPDCEDGLDDDEAATTECEDKVDNDKDGWIDADDADCALGGTAEDGAMDAKYECSDGVDNDKDKLVDADDPECDNGVDVSEAK